MQTTPHYRLVLEVNKERVSLCLYETDRLVERYLVGTAYEMEEKLLLAIDALLCAHHLAAADVNAFDIVSDVPEGYSARRIAETVTSLFRFAL